METRTISLQIPKHLYTALQSWAAEEQTDMAEIIARLLTQMTKARSLTVNAAQRIETRTDEDVHLTPVSRSEAERASRQRTVRRLYGLWSEADEAAFRRTRQALWSQWQPRDSV